MDFVCLGGDVGRWDRSITCLVDESLSIYSLQCTNFRPLTYHKTSKYAFSVRFAIYSQVYRRDESKNFEIRKILELEDFTKPYFG